MTNEHPNSPLLQRVNIFISSPGDLKPEREIIARSLEKLNDMPQIGEKYYLKGLAYEGEVPPIVGTNAQGVVNRYMIAPQDAYLVICVLWSRMGTPFTDDETGKRFQSGTEYEFLTAYRSQITHGTPQILLYRKAGVAPNASHDQKEKVERFFAQFEGEPPALKGYIVTFRTAEEFEDMLLRDVAHVLYKHPPSPNIAQQISKQEAHTLPVIGDNVVTNTGQIVAVGTNNGTVIVNPPNPIPVLESQIANWHEEEKIVQNQLRKIQNDARIQQNVRRDQADNNRPVRLLLIGLGFLVVTSIAYSVNNMLGLGVGLVTAGLIAVNFSRLMSDATQSNNFDSEERRLKEIIDDLNRRIQKNRAEINRLDAHHQTNEPKGVSR
jgi:hypothetical protein